LSTGYAQQTRILDGPENLCSDGYISQVSVELKTDQVAAVTMLLQAGKSIRDIAKFAEIDTDAITQVARELDLEPATPAQRRGKELYTSSAALTYQEIAKTLASEGFTAEDDAPMHHLTVASWVRNMGWPWGGAEDGDYAPERAAAAPMRSRYVLRLSKALDAEVNDPAKIAGAVEAAWSELSTDKTRIVQQAVIRAAATTGVTDLVALKKALLEKYGQAIRTARE